MPSLSIFVKPVFGNFNAILNQNLEKINAPQSFKGPCYSDLQTFCIMELAKSELACHAR
jgi:hypothetical protein